MDEHGWLQKSEEILSDIKEWRRGHPKATFVEIEDEVHKRMMQLEVQVLQEAAQESSSREWGGTLGEEHPRCPNCAVPLQARGKHKRTLQGNGGQSITLHRTYGTCPRCGESFFPLDDELGLLPGNLAPRQHEHLVHLASWMPFAWAARMLEHLLGVQVSEETVRRLTEQAGARVEAAQTAQAKAPVQEKPQTKVVSARLVMSAEGACVPLLKGEWAEVRTVAIGEVEERCTAAGKQEIHVGQLSYFSRLTDAETFADLAEVEMQRRKVVQAEHVCAVTDGADWLQGFIDWHRSDAVRILDFPHGASHLSNLLEALEKMGHRFPDQTLERCLHVLKHRGPRPLLRMSQRLPAELTERAGVREHLGYLRKREGLMQYPQFRRQGWPIGSGMVHRSAVRACGCAKSLPDSTDLSMTLQTSLRA